MDDTWPLQDHKAVIATVKSIVEHSEGLDAFESDFLKEVLRCATRFRDKFRLSPKQVEMLNLLEAQHAIVGMINAKTKKDHDQLATAVMAAAFTPESKP
jgi:hypothetical protein